MPAPSPKPVAAVAPPFGGLITPTGLAHAGLLAVAFITLFHFFFYQQGRQSAHSADWSHAFLVPLISLYIIWQNRHKIAALPAETFWPGIIPMFLGVSAYTLFQIGAAQNHMGQGWAMILTLFGLVLLTAGPRITAHLFLPISYLAFGVTIAEMIMLRVTFKLQQLAAYGAYVMLSVLGVNTSISGTSLTVTNSAGTELPLNVAEACSGMRMVIAFGALGVAVALVGVRHWWQRTALILLAVPVALFMNIVRVAALGVGSLYDPEIARGQAHMFVGTLLLIVAFFIYMGLVWALNRVVVDSPEPKPELPPPPPGGWPQRVNWSFLRRPAFVVPFAFMMACAIGLPTAIGALGIHLRKTPIYAPEGRKIHTVPVETASWIRQGPDQTFSPEMVEELGTDNYVSRGYVQKSPPKGQAPIRLEVHLAYYTGMIDTVPHVPERCVVGAGWDLVETANSVPVPLDVSRWSHPADAPVANDSSGRPWADPSQLWLAAPDERYTDMKPLRPVLLPVGAQNIAMRISTFQHKSGAKMSAGYFFIANGGHCASAEDVRSLAFRLTDNYAYYTKVQVTCYQAVSAQDLAKHAGSLLDELLPEIMRCVPDWSEVEAGRYPPDNPRGRKAANRS